MIEQERLAKLNGYGAYHSAAMREHSMERSDMQVGRRAPCGHIYCPPFPCRFTSNDRACYIL